MIIHKATNFSYVFFPVTKTTDFRPAQDVKYFLLHCNISGFDNNLPDIQYQWSFNNQSIPRTHKKYVYGMAEDGRTHLNVSNPGKLTEIDLDL